MARKTRIFSGEQWRLKVWTEDPRDPAAHDWPPEKEAAQDAAHQRGLDEEAEAPISTAEALDALHELGTEGKGNPTRAEVEAKVRSRRAPA